MGFSVYAGANPQYQNIFQERNRVKLDEGISLRVTAWTINQYSVQYFWVMTMLKQEIALSGNRSSFLN